MYTYLNYYGTAIIIIVIIIVIIPSKFFLLALVNGLSLKSKRQQVSKTLLSILANLSYAVA